MRLVRVYSSGRAIAMERESAQSKAGGDDQRATGVRRIGSHVWRCTSSRTPVDERPGVRLRICTILHVKVLRRMRRRPALMTTLLHVAHYLRLLLAAAVAAAAAYLSFVSSPIALYARQAGKYVRPSSACLRESSTTLSFSSSSSSTSIAAKTTTTAAALVSSKLKPLKPLTHLAILLTVRSN